MHFWIFWLSIQRQFSTPSIDSVRVNKTLICKWSSKGKESDCKFSVVYTSFATTNKQETIGIVRTLNIHKKGNIQLKKNILKEQKNILFHIFITGHSDYSIIQLNHPRRNWIFWRLHINIRRIIISAWIYYSFWTVLNLSSRNTSTRDVTLLIVNILRRI